LVARPALAIAKYASIIAVSALMRCWEVWVWVSRSLRIDWGPVEFTTACVLLVWLSARSNWRANVRRTGRTATACWPVLDGLGAAVDELAPDRPAFALALRWAELNRPAPVPPVFVHGDFRIGNVLVDESGVVAVVDWEFARYGDIAEDLAFFCMRPWRFGRQQYPAGGIGSRQTLLDAYAEVSGVDIPRKRMHYWEIVNQIRWGVYCLSQTADYSSGEHQSLEPFVLGRRAAEAEWDVLSLIAEAVDE
jgi:Ser/Thr protein kinase RdoA (MazF antagonist)